MKITILPFHNSRKKDFFEINAEWISNMFVLEDLDKQVLENPEEMIIKPGGHIFFVEAEGLGVVGTCALRKTDNNEYELTKMGVLEKARGLKAGEALLKHVIEFVKNENLGLCYLLTNSKCEAAIHLYEKNGFVHDEQIKQKYGCLYARCDVAMKLVN